MKKEKVLYIDFDGTLTNDRYWRSLPSDQHEAVQNLLFKESRPMVGRWMRGEYTAEEINQFVSEKMKIPYDELWEIFVSDCRNIKVSDILLEKIDSLRSEYITILITGNMDSFSRFTVPALKLDNYFDHISCSYYEKIHKTDDAGQLFSRWADKVHVPLSQSVLIDDQQKVCDIFSSLEGTSKLTTSLDNTLNILNSL